MKKLFPYLLVFLLLGAGVAAIKWKERNDAMAGLKAERDFRIENPDAIGKIFIAQRGGNKTLLERNGDGWTYNRKWKARQDAVQNLLDALTRLQVQYQPAAAAVPNIVRSLATEGIKVEIYDRRGKLLKAYFLGGSSIDERGVFAIREGFQQPYIAHLDGWEGNPRFRYNLTGEDWRDRSIFAENPDQIQEVRIEYPSQRNQSFRLSKKNGEYQIRPFFQVTPRIQSPYLPGSAEQFLASFESIAAEDFRNTFPGKDSILQTLPFAVITVKNSAGTEKSARLYPIFPDIPMSPEQDSPIERYFVATGTGDFMLAQQRVLMKILWGYPFFFEKN